MNYVEVDSFLKELGDSKPGMSKPVQVIGSDANTYILKNQNVYHEGKWLKWNCMFIQEVLVSRICQYLGIRTPNFAIARVDKSFLEKSPSLLFTNRYDVGYHFASEYIENIEDNLLEGYQLLMRMNRPYTKTSWRAFFEKISNKEDMAKIIALDLLSGNYDRFGNEGNLMVASESGKRYAYAIDHGHCFQGPNWNEMKQQSYMHIKIDQQYVNNVLTDLQRYSGAPLSGLGIIFKAMDQYIDVSDPQKHSFKDVVFLIEKINEVMIDDWFKGIPDEWFIDKNKQIAFYKAYLLRKKDVIRHILNALVQNRAFDNYTGGVLHWKELRTGTQ